MASRSSETSQPLNVPLTLLSFVLCSFVNNTFLDLDEFYFNGQSPNPPLGSGWAGAPLGSFLVEVGKFQNYGDGVGTPFGGHGL